MPPPLPPPMSIDSSPAPPPPSLPLPPPPPSSCSSTTGHAQAPPRGRFMTTVPAKPKTQRQGRSSTEKRVMGEPAPQRTKTATVSKEVGPRPRCGLEESTAERGADRTRGAVRRKKQPRRAECASSNDEQGVEGLDRGRGGTDTETAATDSHRRPRRRVGSAPGLVAGGKGGGVECPLDRLLAGAFTNDPFQRGRGEGRGHGMWLGQRGEPPLRQLPVNARQRGRDTQVAWTPLHCVQSSRAKHCGAPLPAASPRLSGGCQHN